jgi:integrase
MARRRRNQRPEPRKEKGSWKIRYWTDQVQTDGTVQRVRRTKCLGPEGSMTLTQARKETQRFLQPINDVEEGIEYSAKIMNDFIGQWRALVKPNLKRSTQEGYEWAFKRINKSFGPVPVSEIEKVDVQRFLTSAAATLSGKSVRDLKAYTSGLFSVAEEWGWIKFGSSPVRGRFRLPENAPTRPKVVLNPAQFQDLFLLLTQPYRTLLAVAVLCGLRKGELEALRWCDVSHQGLRVDETVYRGELGTPKTRKSRRVVAVGAFASAMIEEWRLQCKFTGPDDFMFSIRTNSPIDLHNIAARHVQPACEKLGLPKVSWHDFRHTYTTWARRAGVAAEAVRDQLGHSSIRTTLDIYSHTDDSGSIPSQIEAYGLQIHDGGASITGTPNGTPDQNSDLQGIEKIGTGAQNRTGDLLIHNQAL